MHTYMDTHILEINLIFAARKLCIWPFLGLTKNIVVSGEVMKISGVGLGKIIFYRENGGLNQKLDAFDTVFSQESPVFFRQISCNSCNFRRKTPWHAWKRQYFFFGRPYMILGDFIYI